MFPATTHSVIRAVRIAGPDTVQCLGLHDNRLFVGLNGGWLQVYQLASSPPDGPSTNSQSASDSHIPEWKGKLYSSQEIRKLQLVSPDAFLVVQTDRQIELFCSDTFQSCSKLDHTNDLTPFSIFTADPSTATDNSPSLGWKLAAGSSGRLLVWHWSSTSRNASTSPAFTAVNFEPETDEVQPLAWIDAFTIVIRVGFKIVLHNLQTETTVDVTVDGHHFPGINLLPVNSKSGGGNIFKWKSWLRNSSNLYHPAYYHAAALCSSTAILRAGPENALIDASGTVVQTGPSKWQGSTAGLVYSHPFIVSLEDQPSPRLDIRHPTTHSVLHSIPVPDARTIAANTSPHDRSGHGISFVVAGPKFISVAYPLPLTDIVNELISQDHHNEALELISIAPPPLHDDLLELRTRIKKSQGLSLFHKQRFREAMELFFEDKVHPRFVLSLFPSSVFMPGDLRPPLASTALSASQPTAETSTFSSLSRSLDTALQPSSGWEARLDAVDLESLLFDTREGVIPSDDQHLSAALNDLRQFLYNTHSRIRREFLTPDGSLKPPEPDGLSPHPDDPHPAFFYLLDNSTSVEPGQYAEHLLQVAVMVDTALFCTIMRVQSSLVYTLFAMPNWCQPMVVKRWLLPNAAYNDLVRFYKGKGAHGTALQILSLIGKSGQGDSTFHGSEMTLSYIRTMQDFDFDILVEPLTWALRQDQPATLEALRYLLANHVLKSSQILDFLIPISPIIAIAFIEPLIFENGDKCSHLHTTLLKLYLAQLQNLDDDSRSPESEGWSNSLERLLSHSDSYDGHDVLSLLPENDQRFYEPRTIVFTKLKEYESVLNIYLFLMGDYQRAESLCHELYDIQGAPNLYDSLLRLLVEPPSPRHPDRARALDFVSRFGSRLSPGSTLNILPPGQSVSSLTAYLTAHFKSATTDLHNAAFLSSLSASNSSSSLATLSLQVKSRKLTLHNRLSCAVCGMPLKDPFVAIGPDDMPRHFSCLQSYRV